MTGIDLIDKGYQDTRLSVGRVSGYPEPLITIHAFLLTSRLYYCIYNKVAKGVTYGWVKV